MNIGIALSGGGARGVFHIGVLQALKDNDKEPEIISGTSVGALVGALYAAGIEPEEILNLALKTSWFSFLTVQLPKNGIASLDYIKVIIGKSIPANRFESLRKPLYVTATNLNKGELDIFSEGELSSPIMASCAIPMIFKPIVYNEQTYLDGGIMMNLPASIIRKKCDFLIGSNLIPHHEVQKNELNGYTQLMARVLELNVNNNMINQKLICDLLIETEEICRFSKFDFKESKQLFQVAYDVTTKMITQSNA